MNTLIVIYGQIRTFSECFPSIYKNVILENGPCHVVLAIDGKYSDIPGDIIKLLDPYLYDIFVSHLHEDDCVRDHHRIEFSLVKNILSKIQNDNNYTFMIKIRTDVYIRKPINLKKIYVCSSEWSHDIFVSNKLIEEKCKNYILSGGFTFFLDRILNNKKSVSPWSLCNDWNKHILEKINIISDEKLKTKYQIQLFLRNFMRKEKIVYLIGSTWIHFGYFQDLYDISMKIEKMYGSLLWPNKKDDDELSWIDHKDQKRTLSQKKWKWITDDQLRQIHHHYNYCLIDLVNPNDYIESFDAQHKFNENKKNSSLFAFLVRPHQLI